MQKSGFEEMQGCLIMLYETVLVNPNYLCLGATSLDKGRLREQSWAGVSVPQ